MNYPDLTELSLNRDQPLQGQLYTQLAEWICTGRLVPGQQLPSSRRLATDLSVSRNTVTLVLDQLRSEGFLESHQGRGVYISKKLPPASTSMEKANWTPAFRFPTLSQLGEQLQRFQELPSGTSLPCAPGIPDLQAFPKRIWNSLYRHHATRLPLMGYGSKQGYLPLRESLAEYLRVSRGVRCEPDQIIITNGAQEALTLCAQVTVNQHESVLIENPGYRRARQVFQCKQSKLIPVDLKDGYIDVDALESLENNASILYLTPTHQYPMGGVMPAHERIRLLEWAAATSTWLLEDDYDSEFSFNRKPVAALQGMADRTPVIYMGSFSKTLLPSLRLGYLVVPKETVNAFVSAKYQLSGDTPLLAQAVVADFISEGHFVRHLRKMRALYKQKWEHICELIKTELPESVELIANSAGMHVVISTQGYDDLKLQQQLLKEGIGCTPLSLFYIGSKTQSGLVLGFANTNPDERIKCVEILKMGLESAVMRETS